ncbi:E2F/DP family, winged-helix DNA-binding domain [Dillenia turbinata]|uniref:E2F/DP family, winged-helix DNA-binding domain n=1 Tax=Dillenia turbinata TaxID=194707 RepID=A0AAN8V7H1_9MAGN
MALVEVNEPVSKSQTYSRKQKSLGLLCTNFLKLYNREDVHLIGLDNAASLLGVERRRIYDIVNVLESIGVLARKAKNQYSWKGFKGIPRALKELKEEGLREGFIAHQYHAIRDAKVSDDDGDDYDDDDDERGLNPNSSSQPDRSNSSSASKTLGASKSDNRREKSLGLLTQNFVKLFVCSNVELISLEEAARILLGDGQHASIMRTKVRRLYDIANVLSSMHLIEKIHHPETRKPAFRWLGLKFADVAATSVDFNESKKRVFGTEITNTSYKRNKVEPVEKNMYPKLNMHVKDETLENEVQMNMLDQDMNQSSKSYRFGPFAPNSMPKPKAIAPEGSRIRKVHDFESLADIYCPQYQNQENVLSIHSVSLNPFTHYPLLSDILSEVDMLVGLSREVLRTIYFSKSTTIA